MGVVAGCSAIGVFIGLTIYTPIYLEGMYGLTATQSGFTLIPLMVGTVAGATLSGRYMARITHYKRPTIIGLVVAATGLVGVAVQPQSLPLIAFALILTVASAGLGTVFPLTLVSIQNAVQPHQMGTATGTLNFFRSLGGALIVAVFGAIVIGGLPTNVASHVTIDNLANTFAAAGRDIGSVFRWVFIAATGGIMIAMVSLFVMEEKPLRTHTRPAAGAAE
jgi:MFS family permease